MFTTFLANQLRERVSVLEAVETANDDGGFDRSYTTLTTIWAGIKPISLKPRYIRGVQIENTPTHEFILRRDSVSYLNTQFSSAFSSAFDSITDVNPMKSDWYFFVQRGSSSKGRLFRIHGIEDVLERRNHLRVYAEEINEEGTGWPE